MNVKRKQWHFGVTIFACTLLIACCTIAQTETQLEKVLPLSPNAASFQKFTDVPVGYYTGLPNISVPVYSIKSGSLELPISLNYHAGGVKVDDIASWVGMGWNLSSGGIITRQVRGLPDYGANYGANYNYNNTNNWIDNFSTFYNSKRFVYYNESKLGNLDGQPDIYNVSLSGESFKFFGTPSGRIVTKPLKRTKVEVINYVGPWSYGWKVTNESGTEYFFEESEITTTFNPFQPTQDAITNVSAWHITKIKSANGLDSICFEYEQEQQRYVADVNLYMSMYTSGCLQNLCELDDVSPIIQASASSVSVIAKHIKKITFNQGTVLFNKATVKRSDLKDCYALESITIKNKQNQQTFKTILHTEDIAVNSTSNIEEDLHRLFLDSLTFTGSDTNYKNKYKFDYISKDALPQRRSYNQDYWGYFNNASNGISIPLYGFIPFVVSPAGDGADPNTFLPKNSVDKNINEETSVYGTLGRITYPTGGYADFKYENNTISNFGDLLNATSKSYGLGLDLIDTTTIYTFEANPSSTPKIYYGAFDITSTFSTGVNKALVKIDAVLPSVPHSNSGIPMLPTGFPDVYITYPDGTHHRIAEDLPLQGLPVGHYTIKADFQNSDYRDSTYAISHFQVKVTTTYGVLNNPAKKFKAKWGGLRIKEIDNYDGLGKLANSKQYIYDDSLASYGISLSFPAYFSDDHILQHGRIICDSSFEPLEGDCRALRFNSTSQLSMLFQNGSPVTYSKVREFFGEINKNGENVYHFSQDFHPTLLQQSATYPNAPADCNDEIQGLLLKKQTYISNNISGTKRLLTEKINTYNCQSNFGGYDADSNIISKGIKFGNYISFLRRVTSCTNGVIIPAQPSEMCHWKEYKFAQYNTTTGWIKLLSDITKTYDESGRVITTTNTYDYSPENLQVNKITTTNSKGQTIVSRTWYPTDYNNVTNSNIDNLKNKNMLTLPVRKETWVNGKVKEGVLFNYNAVGKPTSISSYENTALIVPATHDPNSLTLPNYNARIFATYDANSNLVEQKKKEDASEVYIWGYHHQYPVAKIVGSDYATVNALLSSNDKAALDNAIEGTTSDVAIRSILNSIRTSLPNALVTTNTYQPLVGVTSETDPNGKTIYYEYDSFNRLKLIRDKDNKILKTFEYKYQETQ